MIEKMTKEMWGDYYNLTNAQFKDKYKVNNNFMLHLTKDMKEHGYPLKKSFISKKTCIKEHVRRNKELAYHVQHSFSKIMLKFGRYKTYEEANDIAEALMNVNWNVYLLDEEKRQIIYDHLEGKDRCTIDELHWDANRKRFDVIVYEVNRGFRYTVADAIKLRNKYFDSNEHKERYKLLIEQKEILKCYNNGYFVNHVNYARQTHTKHKRIWRYHYRPPNKNKPVVFTSRDFFELKDKVIENGYPWENGEKIQ